MPGEATSSRCSQAARLLVEDGEFGVVNSGGEVNGAADGTRTRDPRRDRPVYADPSLTYQVSGLKNGDSAGSILTGGLNRVAGENVGVYGINQGDLALNSGNYDLSYQGNNLTITKALLNVIADAKTKEARYSAALGPYRRALQQGSGAWPLEGHA